MEAELFGHERSAFTDAKQMKKGLFEMADGGTLFLDEIGELSPLLQAKLLRVLEDQVIRRVGGVRDMQVNVRVVAASNRDLEKAVRENQFRLDLYYRLAIIAIVIPPLRDRKEDIPPCSTFSLTAITARELKNSIERAMILEEDPLLRPVYLPFSVAQSGRSHCIRANLARRIDPHAAKWKNAAAALYSRGRNVARGSRALYGRACHAPGQRQPDTRR
jgi:two-component system, NtrC family, response regulator AtoC